MLLMVMMMIVIVIVVDMVTVMIKTTTEMIAIMFYLFTSRSTEFYQDRDGVGPGGVSPHG